MSGMSFQVQRSLFQLVSELLHPLRLCELRVRVEPETAVFVLKDEIWNKKMKFFGKKNKVSQASLRRIVNASALVLQIEATFVNVYKVIIKEAEIQGEPLHIESWDPQPYFSDRKGVRFFEEISRRTQNICLNEQIDCLALTLPGTLDGVTTIEGSSRLGILDSVNVSTECMRLCKLPAYVFHDVECLAIGEFLSCMSPPKDKMELMNATFIYILVDEGVGSSLFINGRPYRGAGVAGHIGRLVMQPCGTFNPTFQSRGTLEVFAARPWVSQNVVNEYLAEKGKSGAQPYTASAFRTAVETAVESKTPQKLSLQIIAAGVKIRDPIVMTVLEDAAQNLGFAINAVITIMNPPLIMLGGGMITGIPGFSQMVVSCARRNAFAGSWNETKIHIAKNGRDAQIIGTAYFVSHIDEIN